jgi:hypothetical protein
LARAARAFRDALRRDPTLAADYEMLKRRLREEYRLTSAPIRPESETLSLASWPTMGFSWDVGSAWRFVGDIPEYWRTRKWSRQALSREKNEQHHNEQDRGKGADSGHHVRGSIHGLRPQAFD